MNDSGSILEGGLILLAVLAVVACALTVRRQHSLWPTARRKHAAASSEAGGNADPELGRGILELCGRFEELVNRLEAQWEARISRLEQVVAAMDGRVGQLECLKQPLAVNTVAELPEPAEQPVDSPLVYESEPAASILAEPALESGVTSKSVPAADVWPEMQRIYEMADRGVSAIKIAETVAVPLGEVELALNLRRFAGGA